jgi:hypothetical protein
MSSVLDAETPGLVVYLGDVITANNLATHNASLYWDKAISPARDRNIPWATLFGNHDDAKFEWPKAWLSASGVPPTRCPGTTSGCPSRGTTRVELVQEEIKASVKGLSRTMMGPNQLLPSVSNYVLPLKSSDPSKPAVALLYFLDSGGGSYPSVISNAQVEWFKTVSNARNPDLRIPELIFWHIPSKAYEKVAPPSTDDEISKPCVGSITFDGKVATQDAENGMMAVLENRSSVKAVFVGHNHGLDWCCPGEKNLWLCFARHTGYGGYGFWDRGARIVEITETPVGIKSWIRMEDGFVHSEVNLARA